MLWELIIGLLPFKSMTAVQAAFTVVDQGVHPPIPADCPLALAHIMSRCCDANSDVQPGFMLMVKMLEQACEEIMTTVQHARFWDVDVWQCLT